MVSNNPMTLFSTQNANASACRDEDAEKGSRAKGGSLFLRVSLAFVAAFALCCALAGCSAASDSNPQSATGEAAVSLDELPEYSGTLVLEINGNQPGFTEDEITRAQAEGLARDCLARVGMADRADAYPAQLSGGQQQRVAIARAMATDPEIIYFDEPTSALDPELTAEVLGSMRQLAEDGMTMLVVTHEMSFAKNVADRVVFMEDGAVVASAPAHEFFDHPANDRVRTFLNTIADR